MVRQEEENKSRKTATQKLSQFTAVRQAYDSRRTSALVAFMPLFLFIFFAHTFAGTGQEIQKFVDPTEASFVLRFVLN